METIRSSTGLSATAGKRCRRKKVRKLTEGGGVEASHGESGALVQLEDPNGSEGRDPSVYLAVCRVYWFNGSGYYPLHKVDVASSSSGDSSSSPRAHTASRVANLRTDVGYKTFVTLQSRWIVCVGGDPGGTVIFDTETAKVTPGPTLVAAKLFPVVAAVGYRVYALSMTPDFIKEPDFVPWFEVLDLSKAVDAEGDLTLLDRCSWEALPCPLCYPRKLPTADYLTPPIFTVTSYVVVGHYIILTLYEPGKTYGVQFYPEQFHKVTYGFDTESEEWHKVDDDACLPFVGPATPHGRSGRVFLGLSRKNGPINAYRISVSSSTSSGSSTMAGGSASDKRGALKLSVAVFSVETMADEQVGAGTGHYFTSLDRASFSTLCYSLDNRERYKKYCEETGEYYSRLNAKLRIYQIGSESLALLETPDEEKLLGVKQPELAISPANGSRISRSSVLIDSTPHHPSPSFHPYE